MPRRTRLSKAAKALRNTAKRLTPTSKEARTVGGIALGAAAVAAAGIAAKKVGDAVREGNAALDLQRMAAKRVSLSSSRKRRKRGPATRQSKKRKRSSAKSTSRRAATR